MKRISIILISLLTIMSCVKENERVTETDLHEVVFHAGWDDETKTVLQEDGSIFWSPGDEISVFTGSGDNGGYKFKSTNTEPSQKVDFAGFADEGALYAAIYPYDTDNSYEKSTFYIRHRSWQNAREGTFDPSSFPSIALSSDNNLYFRNLCGGIKLTVAQEGITRLKIHADGTAIAGLFSYVMDENGVPQFQGNSTYGYNIEVYAPNDSSFEPGKSYYISLPAIVIPDGLEITFYKDKEYARWAYIKPIEIHRSVFKRLDCVDRDLYFHPEPDYNNITILTSSLPSDFDKEKITNVLFHVNDNTTTEKLIGATIPVYYDIDNTTLHFYTTASSYDLSYIAPTMFYNYKRLKEIDLSNTIFSGASLYRMFGKCNSLETITFGNWDTYRVSTMCSMFSGCENLKSLDLSFMDTSRVTDMSFMFMHCQSLSSLSLKNFNTSNVANMAGMFSGCMLTSFDLQSFDTSNVTNMAAMFSDCDMLSSLDISHFDTRQVKDMSNMFCRSSLHTLDLSSFDTSNVENMNGMFTECLRLESLNLSNFNTSKVRDMSWMFVWCSALKNLDISSFASESLESADSMFGSCMKLQKLNLGSFDLSKVNPSEIALGLMEGSKAGAIRCIPATRAKLEECIPSTVSRGITWMTLSDNIDTYVYPRNPNLYYSSDFSKHETVKKIYSATKGKGIDIVLMGDAYSDRMIDSGEYDADMELAVDAIFSKEPMTSYKDHFNIYVVYLVSDNETLGESTALDGISSGSGSLAGYASASVPSHYRILATGNPDLYVSDAIVVVRGTEYVSGYTNLIAQDFDTHQYDCDYGRGVSSIVVGRGNPNYSEEFKTTVAHEFGHSFAKLADEYFHGESQLVDAPNSDIVLWCERFGWYKNVDITSDPASVRWAQFLNDPRYANENLGTFEGGHLFRYGVWRPNENSIMRNGSEYNAPSRAAIYNRIHKLAYGDSWKFDYETFVQQDLKNIQPAASSANVKSGPYPARVNKKHLFQMEESVTPNGKKMVTIIRD